MQHLIESKYVYLYSPDFLRERFIKSPANYEHIIPEPEQKQLAATAQVDISKNRGTNIQEPIRTLSYHRYLKPKGEALECYLLVPVPLSAVTYPLDKNTC